MISSSLARRKAFEVIVIQTEKNCTKMGPHDLYKWNYRAPKKMAV